MQKENLILQSNAAYDQWKDQWREHAKIHSQYPMKDLSELQASGLGKAIVACANGYSLELNMQTLINHKDNVDIMACDKSLGHLLNNGIKPKYCLVCDANVNYEKYLEPYEDMLDETILIMNVCANPKWTQNGNWKNKYFFVNKDVIQSELEFSKISGCKNTIPAATNVSNAMIVMLTQSTNEQRLNYFGYDKILLIGFDYSWRFGGKYYAYDEDGGGKANYMRHCFVINQDGKYAYSSGNLQFSAKWVQEYIQAFNLPVIQCSKETILSNLKYGKLEDHITYGFKKEDARIVKILIQELNVIETKRKKIFEQISGIEKEHFYSFLGSV